MGLNKRAVGGLYLTFCYCVISCYLLGIRNSSCLKCHSVETDADLLECVVLSTETLKMTVCRAARVGKSKVKSVRLRF